MPEILHVWGIFQQAGLSTQALPAHAGATARSFLCSQSPSFQLNTCISCPYCKRRSCLDRLLVEGQQQHPQPHVLLGTPILAVGASAAQRGISRNPLVWKAEGVLEFSARAISETRVNKIKMKKNR